MTTATRAHPARHYAALAGIIVALGGGGSPADPDISVPDGFAVTELIDGLSQPTQIVIDSDDVLIAQLNGGEDDGTGQVLRISLDDPTQREVLFDDLLKPTGLALLDDELWVMEERTL